MKKKYSFGDVESIDSDGTQVYFGLPRWPHSSIILILKGRNWNVLLWVYRLDIVENCYRLVYVCDCILRRTFWNFFFSARLHFIDNLQPPGSLGMLFLSNACHKSASVIRRQFPCSSSFIRCFSLSCNLISISQHLLNIHRRTSRRQF